MEASFGNLTENTVALHPVDLYHFSNVKTLRLRPMTGLAVIGWTHQSSPFPITPPQSGRGLLYLRATLDRAESGHVEGSFL